MQSFTDATVPPKDDHPIVLVHWPWRLRIAPNLFGIAFGLAGLAAAWRAAEPIFGTPPSLADALSAVAAAVWVVLVFLYLSQGPHQIASDLRHDVLAPFVAIAPICGMLLASTLAQYELQVARTLVVACMAATIGLGGWLTGQWIVRELDQGAVHPGYFLPTVAGGLVGSLAAAEVQLQGLAEAAFGIGIICWLVLGSILLNRLFFRSSLPSSLVPTLAIELAPPAVAGVAYSAMTGGAADMFAIALAGYALLMVLVQLRLAPVYARLRFGLGFWAFTFSYAAAATDALSWISHAEPPGSKLYAGAVLGLVTVIILAIATRSLLLVLPLRSMVVVRRGTSPRV
jgi:tellurite resistance protein